MDGFPTAYSALLLIAMFASFTKTHGALRLERLDKILASKYFVVSYLFMFFIYSLFLFSFFSLELNISFVPPLYMIFHISLKQIAVYLKIWKRRIVIIIYQDHSQGNVVNPIVTDQRSRTGKSQEGMVIF